MKWLLQVLEKRSKKGEATPRELKVLAWLRKRYHKRSPLTKAEKILRRKTGTVQAEYSPIGVYQDAGLKQLGPTVARSRAVPTKWLSNPNGHRNSPLAKHRRRRFEMSYEEYMAKLKIEDPWRYVILKKRSEEATKRRQIAGLTQSKCSPNVHKRKVTLAKVKFE